MAWRFVTFPAQTTSYLIESLSLERETELHMTQFTTVTVSAGLAISAIVVIVAMFASVTTRMEITMEKLTKFFKKCYDGFIAISGYIVIACDKVKAFATWLKEFTVDLVNVVVTHFNKKE